MAGHDTTRDARRRPHRRQDAGTPRRARQAAGRTSGGRRPAGSGHAAGTGVPVPLPAVLAAVALVAIAIAFAFARSCSAGGATDGVAAGTGQAGAASATAVTPDAPDDATAGSAASGQTASAQGQAGSEDAPSGEDGTRQATAPLSEGALGFAGSRKKGPITTTPREQWARGSVPFLYQKDPVWSGVGYADGTVGSHGCGPACLSMAYIALTGDTSMDPASMCAFSESNGFVEASVTSWRLMDEGAPMLGLTVHPVLTEVSGIRAALEAGQILIQDCDPGDFTAHGHFILICGIDENDQLTIHDPNSSYNSAVTWDAQRVLDQHRNIWGFTYEG